MNIYLDEDMASAMLVQLLRRAVGDLLGRPKLTLPDVLDERGRIAQGIERMARHPDRERDDPTPNGPAHSARKRSAVLCQ